MKKVMSVFLLISLILCICISANAQGNVSDIFGSNQDYLLLATVIDVTDTSVFVAPYHNIYNGDDTKQMPLTSNIEISKFRYSYCSDHSDISATPRMGDNIFISLNKNGDVYKMANGAYKTSSVDYKMLNFYASESMKGSDCLAEIVALANFVRTDGTMRDFRFEGGTLTVNSDGKILTLYPTNPPEKIEETVTFLDVSGKAVGNVESRDVITDGILPAENGFDFRWAISLIMIVMSTLAGGVVMYNVSMREGKEKKQKEN